MIGTLDSARTQVVMESLLQKIVETGSALAIIDITGVPTVDTLTAQHLLKTVTAARLMGAECIISGIRPQIAQTIVHLGVDLGDVITKASLADALALALEKTGRTVSSRQGSKVSRELPWNIYRSCGWGNSCSSRSRSTCTIGWRWRFRTTSPTGSRETGARGVLIDISSLDMVDSFIGRMIGNIAGMSRVLDAETVVVGHAAGRRHHAGRAGAVAARRPHGTRRREGDGPPAGRDGQRTRERTTMTVSKTDTLPIRSSTDIVLIRQAVRKWTGELGFSLVDQTKMITAASELARNSLDYGGGGAVHLRDRSRTAPNEACGSTFEDQGPGIPDIELALTDGYTTGKGMGLGLGGAKRLVNEFEITSRVGEGTRVTITRWK